MTQIITHLSDPGFVASECTAPAPVQGIVALFYPYTPDWGYSDLADLAHGDPRIHADWKTCQTDDLA